MSSVRAGKCTCCDPAFLELHFFELPSGMISASLIAPSKLFLTASAFAHVLSKEQVRSFYAGGWIGASSVFSGKACVAVRTDSGGVATVLSEDLEPESRFATDFEPETCALTRSGPLICEFDECALYDWSGRKLWSTLVDWADSSENVGRVLATNSKAFVLGRVLSLKDGTVIGETGKRRKHVIAAKGDCVLELEWHGTGHVLRAVRDSTGAVVWEHRTNDVLFSADATPDCSLIAFTPASGRSVFIASGGRTAECRLPVQTVGVSVERGSVLALALEGAVLIEPT